VLLQRHAGVLSVSGVGYRRWSGYGGIERSGDIEEGTDEEAARTLGLKLHVPACEHGTRVRAGLRRAVKQLQAGGMGRRATIRGKPADICSLRGFRILTRLYGPAVCWLMAPTLSNLCVKFGTRSVRQCPITNVLCGNVN
jgi:hypothetical protein